MALLCTQTGGLVDQGAVFRHGAHAALMRPEGAADGAGRSTWISDRSA